MNSLQNYRFDNAVTSARFFSGKLDLHHLIVLGEKMDESIYNLVPKEYVAPVKPPMYYSQHDPLANLTGSTFGEHFLYDQCNP